MESAALATLAVRRDFDVFELFFERRADVFEADDVGADDFDACDFEACDFEADDFEAGDFEAEDFEAGDFEADGFEAGDFEAEESGEEDAARAAFEPVAVPPFDFDVFARRVVFAFALPDVVLETPERDFEVPEPEDALESASGVPDADAACA